MSIAEQLRSQGRAEGIEKGIEKGIDLGIKRGRVEGSIQGQEKDRRIMLLRLLDIFPSLKPEFLNPVKQAKTLQELEQLTQMVEKRIQPS